MSSSQANNSLLPAGKASPAIVSFVSFMVPVPLLPIRLAGVLGKRMGTNLVPSKGIFCNYPSRALFRFIRKRKASAGSCPLLLGSTTVIAGDRQHMAEAGDEHRVVHRGRDRVALAGDQGGGDRAGVAAEA